MTEYKGIVPERTRARRIVFALLAAFMLVRTIMVHKFAYVPLVILVILACFFSKEHIVSEEGVDLRYKLFGKFTIHNWWTWDEITTLHVDYRKAAPKVMLHIGKDVMVRTFIMEESDVMKSVKLARKMNPGIYIED